eukprot:TRINITY_DN2579_c0_g2_i2.p1 TRINITY_DN2579_c0_g2~~TRINITY_DN2579_c0_g2_i2.p1  ORF type:complete len:402 (+),score=126.59 TRINITY_DN2579_c0_g2_i2:44-1249(+)
MEGQNDVPPHSDYSEVDNQAYMVMEDVIDKLFILDYENQFCKSRRKNGFKPMHRLYFAVPAQNINEQYNYFIAMVVWLMGLNGFSVKSPDPLEDPDACVSLILDGFKKLGIPIEIPPPKLKQSYGATVCIVLNLLLDKTLESRRFRYEKPSLTVSDDVDADQITASDTIDETVDEEEGDDLEDDTAFNNNSEENGNVVAIKESTVDSVAWKLEVERVAPSLKMHVVVDHKDWRTHLDQMKEYKREVGANVTKSVSMLEKLSIDIEASLEKISTREKLMNSQFEELLKEYKTTQEAYLILQQKHKQSTETNLNLKNELDDIDQKSRIIEAETRARETDIADESPLATIRKAITKLKEEIAQMEVRIGVVQHTLLQANFRNKEASYASEKVFNTNSLLISDEF